MELSGTWTISQTWDSEIKDQFTATFNANGTVTIVGSTDGFAMVWYTGAQSGQQGVVLAGDNRTAGILATYYGTMAAGNQSMSGSANGIMSTPAGQVPVTGTWMAVPASSPTGGN